MTFKFENGEDQYDGLQCQRLGLGAFQFDVQHDGRMTYANMSEPEAVRLAKHILRSAGYSGTLTKQVVEEVYI